MNDITCPFCSKRLKLQFKDRTTYSIAYFFWGCDGCELSIKKLLTNDELFHYKELKNGS